MNKEKKDLGLFSGIISGLEIWNTKMRLKRIEMELKSEARMAELKLKHPDIDFDAIEEKLKY